MDQAKEAGARLRRKFQYHDDDDSDSQPEAMDEEGM
jgi:hypothetical protein